MKHFNKQKEKKMSIKMNFLMNAILTLSSVIFPLITFPYVSRILLPIGTGKVSLATSFISYFCMFAQLGIPTYGIRACAKVRDSKKELTQVAHELLLINLIMSLISYVVFIVVLVNVSKLWNDRTLYIVVSMTIFLNAIGMEWLYKGLEQYTYITIRSVLFKFVALVLMFTLIHSSADYVLYGGITIFAASASNILNFINAHKYIDIKPTSRYNLKRHLKPVIIFFAMSCATTVYTNLDTVMLGFMKTDVDVGLYNAAVKIKAVLVSVVTSLGAVLLPRASYYVQKGEKEKFNRISQKAINFVFILATPLMIFFILYAKQCIFFLSGIAYKGAIMPMKIIMPTLLFIGLSNLLGIQILIPMGKEKIVLYSEIAGAITDLIFNGLLIPIYSASGAAIGTVAAELVVLIVQYMALRKQVTLFFRKVNYVAIGLGCCLASLLSYWVIKFEFNNFVTLFFAAIIFFGVYLCVLLIMKEEFVIEMVKETIDKKKRG